MEFFRDILDGPLYIVVALLSLIFIMAIIGFMMERKRLEKEEKGRIAYVNNSVNVAIEPVQTKVEETSTVSDAINPVTSNNVATVSTTPVNSNNVVNEQIPAQQDNPSFLVKTPVVVFNDPDKKE